MNIIKLKYLTYGFLGRMIGTRPKEKAKEEKMTQEINFHPATATTAPAANQPILTGIGSKMGFVPNMYGVMGRSEAVLGGYLALDSFFEKTSFSPVERNLIFLAASRANGCQYCVPAHSTILKQFLKVDPAVVASVRAGEPIGNTKLDALVHLTDEIVRTHGHPTPSAIAALISAGYHQDQVLEVLLGVAMKTITNYTGNIADPELDTAFAPER